MKKPVIRGVISGLLAFALVFGTITIAPTRSSGRFAQHVHHRHVPKIRRRIFLR